MKQVSQVFDRSDDLPPNETSEWVSIKERQPTKEDGPFHISGSSHKVCKVDLLVAIREDRKIRSATYFIFFNAEAHNYFLIDAAISSTVTHFMRPPQPPL